MAQAFQHHQLAAFDQALKFLPHGGGYQAVFTAPQNECGLLQCGDSFGTFTDDGALHQLAQCTAIAFAQRQLEVAVHQSGLDA